MSQVIESVKDRVSAVYTGGELRSTYELVDEYDSDNENAPVLTDENAYYGESI